MKKYTFILNFGYVESSGLSYMPWTSTKSYTDAKEALLDLALFFKEQYLLTNGVTQKKCCLLSIEKDSTASFCAKCGLTLLEEEFEPEHFEEWLSSMDGQSIDSFSEIIEYNDENRWQPEFSDLNQRMVYHAEWVMSAAIGHPHRKERTFDLICKERTKEKRESFSYY